MHSHSLCVIRVIISCQKLCVKNTSYATDYTMYMIIWVPFLGGTNFVLKGVM